MVIFWFYLNFERILKDMKILFRLVMKDYKDQREIKVSKDLRVRKAIKVMKATLVQMEIK